MRLRIVLALATTAVLALPGGASADVAHVVAKGQSLTSIAATDGLSVSALAAANGLAPDTELIAGSLLEIPPRGPGAAAVAASRSTSRSLATYIVRRGDTLSGIAARFGLSVSDVAAANGIRPNGVLIADRALIVPRSSGSASEPAVTDPAGSPSGPPYPTPERVTAAQVEQVAVANGVPASLAAAIAWQESGFNNDFVSNADARGVMQILPGTWGWIQQTMTDGTPLAPASAIDNVRGGVLLLRSLLISTGGDQALAAAAYIQGLTSVRRYGIFPATQVYVNDTLALRQRFGAP
jgi:LysM repeat protein